MYGVVEIIMDERLWGILQSDTSDEQKLEALKDIIEEVRKETYEKTKKAFTL